MRRAEYRRRSCVGKRTFRAVEEAEAAAEALNNSALFLTSRWQAYECSFGRHHHIGSSKPKKGETHEMLLRGLQMR